LAIGAKAGVGTKVLLGAISGSAGSAPEVHRPFNRMPDEAGGARASDKQAWRGAPE
jgi:hypothetical protein